VGCKCESKIAIFESKRLPYQPNWSLISTEFNADVSDINRIVVCWIHLQCPQVKCPQTTIRLISETSALNFHKRTTNKFQARTNRNITYTSYYICVLVLQVPRYAWRWCLRLLNMTYGFSSRMYLHGSQISKQLWPATCIWGCKIQSGSEILYLYERSY